MKVDVFNMQGEKIKRVELPAEIFEAPVNVDLMHQAYVQQMANARLGTHKTKTRGEVSGGGRKPWRQKGTGRARQGSTRAPQWKGGGRVHTPRPRKYTQHMPLKMRRAALRSALSVKAAEAGVVLVDELSLPEPKTRLMAQSLGLLVGTASALLLVTEKDANYEVITRSTNNIPDAKVLMANYLNIRDILGYDKLVMPLKALDVLKAYLV
ncbi:50S ribosomal protein L4 [bacterium]|nr:50S ribosomal protein L4 [bacterium]OIO83646.1 MAG: 50S ribosomal protein L4 [Anaerolineae bacterium CG2_30_58_95]PIU91346.1 MAG: 50S ribosomal protein L4 [Anaerolineae bacterium CG06_land_8_20_14_3_00_57_67]PIW20748.1 MAG: 50S ribosomal protein L4 [Anaerolineae bacterium CG17_big_fil_post_rev_8_21_14_2_50_57_27]PIX47831.1 MAG: 50S ribosomal protein L4 [Anaerolineae bacterium CG_4_8_14_3_um_filter_59_70]PJH75217.1 MAG: 50S ribosomal protein L4 [Anaerolineae bacterium CG_4_9_14_0_8_um_filter